MSRNRMKDSQSLHWMGVVKWILIASLIAGLGLCYMLCKNQNLHLAEETHRLQNKLDSIEARNTELADDLESMKSIPLLQRRLREMRSNFIAWNDPRASWLRLDQNTRAHVARMGTLPQQSIGFNSSVVATSTQNPH